MGRNRDAARAGQAAFARTWREYSAENAFTWTYWLAWLTVVGAVITTGVALSSDLAGNPLHLDLPVRATWTPFGDGASIDGGLGRVSDGTVTGLSVDFRDPGVATRVWLAAAHLAAGATWIWIALLVRALIRRVRSGNPFVPALARTFRSAAIVVMIGGIATQVLLGIASTIATNDALAYSGSAYTAPTAPPDMGTMVGLAYPSVQVHVDFWPIGVGLVLLVLARLVRIGERLQSDTVGLV